MIQDEGVGRVEVRGTFMGCGAMRVVANFRPEQTGPDFDVNPAIEHTDMRAMNDVLRAYGKFDVVQGDFSIYSEIRVKSGAVDGYVKPLFKDVKAFDPEQDRHKGFVERLYERIIGGASKVLKNVPRKGRGHQDRHLGARRIAAPARGLAIAAPVGSFGEDYGIT